MDSKLLVLLTFAVIAVLVHSTCGANPSRFQNFLVHNTWNTSTLPLSYRVPYKYFDSIPVEQWYTQPQFQVACNRDVTPEELNKYRMQTEMFLTTFGLNLYDGAVREIALALLGQAHVAQQYEVDTLISGKTFQLANIRGSTACGGIEYFGNCGDPKQSGACGFCYGGNSGDKKGQTLDDKHSFFFRMIGDIYAFDGALDVRCPEKNFPWTWNDWRPVAGENAWANLLGPLQVAYKVANGDANAIDDNSSAFKLASQILTAFEIMQMPNGGIAYAPYNTYDEGNPALGGTGSVENAASSLAGLRVFLQLLQNKSNTQYKSLIPRLQAVITKLTDFIKAAYSPSLGYFHQGGTYDKSGAWKWNTDAASSFAVDCQTWVISVLGAPTIDNWFGAGTTINIWTVTKKLGGYGYDNSDGTVQGVGFSLNQQVQVLSGEWSFGAVNMLRILAKQIPSRAQQLNYEAAVIRQAIDDRLTTHDNQINSDVVSYANKRYFIPFGWYANPIASTASAAWAVMVDSNYNPFALGGSY